jgi:hypothetical protein
VKEPFSVDRIEDFTAAQIERAAEDPSGFSTALVFSTKAEPPWNPFHLNGEAMEEQYFGLHHDLSPAAIANRLGGEIVWHQSDENGLEWAALLRFRRAVEARVELPEGR